MATMALMAGATVDRASARVATFPPRRHQAAAKVAAGSGRLNQRPRQKSALRRCLPCPWSSCVPGSPQPLLRQGRGAALPTCRSARAVARGLYPDGPPKARRRHGRRPLPSPGETRGERHLSSASRPGRRTPPPARRLPPSRRPGRAHPAAARPLPWPRRMSTRTRSWQPEHDPCFRPHKSSSLPTSEKRPLGRKNPSRGRPGNSSTLWTRRRHMSSRASMAASAQCCCTRKRRH
mmetsp:Transcript_18767/g.51582  ORF Transcript_18767/g.51582 Transcript_18767/m.51582 type:complete len:235 (+) Transcript_18767:2088-2792(+)